MNENQHSRMGNNQIRILFLTAEPTDQAKLRLGQEIKNIRIELERSRYKQEQFVLEECWSVSPEDIRYQISKFQPRIVHFCGHGTSSGELCFEDKVGKTKPVRPEALAALFELVGEQVRCVVLNACYSDIQAQAIAQHIPFVVGMNNAISDNAAISFAVGFYGALASGASYEKAYKVACVEIQIRGSSEELTPILRQTGDMYRTVFYSARPTLEEKCFEEIQKPGSLIRIKAPRSMGKTWLMRQIVNYASNKLKYKTLVINCKNLIDEDTSNHIGNFLYKFCSIITEELNLDNQIDKFWNEPKSALNKTTNYFQKYIIPSFDSPFVLAFNYVDCIFEQPILRTELCQMFREWHDLAKQGDAKGQIWEQLRLIIVLSTEVYTELDINHSPLDGVGLAVDLPYLKPEEVKKWFQKHEHQINLSDDQLQQLIDLLGGHTFLIKRTIDYLRVYELPIQEFIENAPTLGGAFQSHLSKLLAILISKPELKKAFSQVLKSPGNSGYRLELKLANKLYCLGLVKWQGDLVIVRCGLYRKFFSNNL